MDEADRVARRGRRRAPQCVPSPVPGMRQMTGSATQAMGRGKYSGTSTKMWSDTIALGSRLHRNSCRLVNCASRSSLTTMAQAIMNGAGGSCWLRWCRPRWPGSASHWSSANIGMLHEVGKRMKTGRGQSSRADPRAAALRSAQHRADADREHQRQMRDLITAAQPALVKEREHRQDHYAGKPHPEDAQHRAQRDGLAGAVIRTRQVSLAGFQLLHRWGPFTRETGIRCDAGAPTPAALGRRPRRSARRLKAARSCVRLRGCRAGCP
jgi:hypothetical protein